jgi:RNA polymerase sigma factor (sigma-70 family)
VLLTSDVLADTADVAVPCPRGPDEEFAAAYPVLFSRAMRLAYRMTRDASLAEDVAAEALARAYSRWSTVQHLDQPEAWIMRVAVNIVIDDSRKTKLLRRWMPTLGSDRETTPAFDDDVAIRNALVAALATLPKRQREAIALRYLAGLDEDDISRSLQISPSSVRTHVQRGLAALRERLGPSVEGSLYATR